MKNTKRFLAVLLAAIFAVNMSACEITKEVDEETTSAVNNSGYEGDEDLEGEDISDLLYTDSTGYQLWYADNGDIYAFNSVNQFYLKNAAGVYYGSYKFTTTTSTLYDGLLSVLSDNDSSIDETFNVKKADDDFILTRASNPDDVVRLTRENASENVTGSEGATDQTAGEAMSEGETAEESIDETKHSGSVSDNVKVFEIMGLDIYYLTMKELVEGEVSVLKVNASPAVEVESEDGTVKYEYDASNSIELSISEDSYVYMPDTAAPTSETYGCDIYQMRDCFEIFGGFYAAVIGENDNIESVQYCYVEQ